MSKGLIATLIVIGGIVLMAFIFVGWGTGVYDNAIKAQENVNEAFSNVQATYQRRADLIPNLVATVKEAAENEIIDEEIKVYTITNEVNNYNHSI